MTPLPKRTPNDTYSSYLQSAAWMEKRTRRIALSGHKCEACGEKERLQVHHLTYERIFREETSDLMTLCEMHHSAVEELVSKGILKRHGDPVTLAAETLRFISPLRHRDFSRGTPSPPTHPQRKQIKKKLSSGPLNFLFEDSSATIRTKLLSVPYIVEMLRAPREKFKKKVRKFFKGYALKSRLISNAIILYDNGSKPQVEPKRESDPF